MGRKQYRSIGAIRTDSCAILPFGQMERTDTVIFHAVAQDTVSEAVYIYERALAAPAPPEQGLG